MLDGTGVKFSWFSFFLDPRTDIWFKSYTKCKEPMKFDGIWEKISTSKTGLWPLVFDWDTCKLLSSYLSPTGVDRNIVWDILKKSPMDPQPILCQVDQKISKISQILPELLGLLISTANAMVRDQKPKVRIGGAIAEDLWTEELFWKG